ncbi:hypothetical protein ACFT5B_09370 [Luteimicrobium sp. NPDC057192]|uniref:hypothetical protein n=1 Tax=Luteimicrobium sp. NPDC057192 TaxID=3346042 RepID=UPI0036269ECB
MPTTRPRHAITETEAVSHALDVARRRWPGERPSSLLTHLILAGADAVQEGQDDTAAERGEAVKRLTSLAAYYPDGYLDDVREGWSE